MTKPLETYLIDEFHRYFPDARMEVKLYGEDITVTIEGVAWDHICGSDDDYYRFVSHLSHEIITIPLAPEDNGWDDLTVEQRGYIVEMMAEQIRDCLDDEAYEQAINLDKQGIKDYLDAMAEDSIETKEKIIDESNDA